MFSILLASSVHSTQRPHTLSASNLSLNYISDPTFGSSYTVYLSRVNADLLGEIEKRTPNSKTGSKTVILIFYDIL